MSTGSPPFLSVGGGEEECELAACKSMLDVLNKAKASANKAGKSSKAKGTKKGASNPQGGAGESGNSASEGSGGGVEPLAAWRRGHCPLTREGLGDVTWALLHSTAAYYPERPSPEDEASARGLINGVAGLYPCSHCREDFQESIKNLPPSVESREAFAVWVCKQHNAVNEKLGKPAFSCDMASLDLRWRTGHKACWEDDAPMPPPPAPKKEDS